MTSAQLFAVIFMAVLVLALIAIIVVSVKTGNYHALAATALQLVQVAEEKFAEEGKKTGDTKYRWVAKQLIAMLPPIVRLFIPASALDQIIEAAVTKMKEQLQKAAD